jgi:hypothetical protein
MAHTLFAYVQVPLGWYRRCPLEDKNGGGCVVNWTYYGEDVATFIVHVHASSTSVGSTRLVRDARLPKRGRRRLPMGVSYGKCQKTLRRGRV